MTDFRALCIEPLAQKAYVAFAQICKGGSDDAGTYGDDEAIVRRALKRLHELESAALAEPKPDGPTDIEIASILKAYAVIEPQMGASRILHEKHFSNAAHAILARLGNHQGMLASSMPQPIPVIKRRPELEDCDAEGRCWWGAPAYPDLAPASWRFVSAKDRFSSELYWLTANALPQPS